MFSFLDLSETTHFPIEFDFKWHWINWGCRTTNARQPDCVKPFVRRTLIIMKTSILSCNTVESFCLATTSQKWLYVERTYGMREDFVSLRRMFLIVSIAPYKDYHLHAICHMSVIKSWKEKKRERENTDSSFTINKILNISNWEFSRKGITSTIAQW